MIRDPEHGDQSIEDGTDWRESSSLASIAYAEWRGPDSEPPASPTTS